MQPAKKSKSSTSIKALAEGIPATPPPAAPPPKKSTSFLKKVECTVSLKQSNLHCDIVGKPPAKPFPIRVTDIVGVKTEERVTETEKFTSLHVFHLDYTRKGKTQVATATIDYTDAEAAEALKKQIEPEIAATSESFFLPFLLLISFSF